MNFFRLRFINTALLLLIGIVLGYVLKDNAVKKSANPYVAKYAAQQAPGAPVPPALSEEASVILPDAQPGVRTREVPLNAARAKREAADADSFELPVKVAIVQDEDEAAYTVEDADMDAPKPVKTYKQPVSDEVAGSEEDFFRNPARFIGREIEMELQMIMAKKTGKGWLLNLVHSRGGKNVDYIYLEDNAVLGDDPELKIGYIYKIRFKCQKGDMSSGNILVSLTPTNNKAAWATGISAVE